jgi:hypothetical protein
MSKIIGLSEQEAELINGGILNFISNYGAAQAFNTSNSQTGFNPAFNGIPYMAGGATSGGNSSNVNQNAAAANFSIVKYKSFL